MPFLLRSADVSLDSMHVCKNRTGYDCTVFLIQMCAYLLLKAMELMMYDTPSSPRFLADSCTEASLVSDLAKVFSRSVASRLNSAAFCFCSKAHRA